MAVYRTYVGSGPDAGSTESSTTLVVGNSLVMPSVRNAPVGLSMLMRYAIQTAGAVGNSAEFPYGVSSTVGHSLVQTYSITGLVGNSVSMIYSVAGITVIITQIGRTRLSRSRDKQRDQDVAREQYRRTAIFRQHASIL
jgi:hypothetical protein